MQQHGSKYFAVSQTPPPIPGPREGVYGLNSTYSEYGHVAYQI